MTDNTINELKKLSILCVEDEDGIRSKLINILSYYFDDIYEASCGNDGYKKYLEYKPDILFTDIKMLDGDGINLIKNIRENDNTMKIVVLTAHSCENVLLKLITLNINQYMIKPFNNKQLKEVLTSLSKKDTNTQIKLYEELQLDTTSRELKYKNKSIILRKRENDFLQLLYENRNVGITSYTQIEETIWQDSYMSTGALKTFVRDLRKKLPIELIVNIPQGGYTLAKDNSKTN